MIFIFNGDVFLVAVVYPHNQRIIFYMNIEVNAVSGGGCWLMGEHEPELVIDFLWIRNISDLFIILYNIQIKIHLVEIHFCFR